MPFASSIKFSNTVSLLTIQLLMDLWNGLIKINLEIVRLVAGKLHESWEDWLPHVAASISGSVNSSTGKTPHYVVFGEDERLPYDTLEAPCMPMYSAEDYAQSHIRTFQTIHASVRERLHS